MGFQIDNTSLFDWKSWVWYLLIGISLKTPKRKKFKPNRCYKVCQTGKGYFILNFESVCSVRSGIFLYSTGLCLNRPHIQYQSHGSIYAYRVDCLLLIFFQAWYELWDRKENFCWRKAHDSASDNIFSSNERTNTSQFIKDVDFAFKGAQESVSTRHELSRSVR